MEKEISCVMLIDDDHPTNVLHRLTIENGGLVKKIIIFDNGFDALTYLNEPFGEEHPKPSIIFLDINMPGMTGWEFLDKFKNLSDEKKSQILLLMLSTSSHPKDLAKADQEDIVKDYIYKPLTEEALSKVHKRYLEEMEEKQIPTTFN